MVAGVVEETADGGPPTGPVTGGSHADRVRLESLRYATVPEAAEYLTIMRTFTSEISGLLSDQSAAEVVARLRAQGIELDADTADARLSYLVEHGNLARSPRDSDPSSPTPSTWAAPSTTANGSASTSATPDPSSMAVG